MRFGINQVVQHFIFLVHCKAINKAMIRLNKKNTDLTKKNNNSNLLKLKAFTDTTTLFHQKFLAEKLAYLCIRIS